MFIELLACGLDPDQTIIFQQSHVPDHAQLQWIFSCLTTMARLDNLPQFKEKSATQKEVPCGLFMYPVLQAADILLYRAELVPMGEDQVHHLHLAQHIARVFNNNHGNFFPTPQRLQSELPRVKSLRDPAKKMSKSEPDTKSRIELSDGPDAIRSKFMKSLTDFPAAITYEPEERPGVSNLLLLYKTITGTSMEQTLEHFSGKDKVALKREVADAVIEMLRPVRERMEYLGRNVDYVEGVVAEGAKKARVLAQETMFRVENLVGFRSSGEKLDVKRVSKQNASLNKVLWWRKRNGFFCRVSAAQHSQSINRSTVCVTVKTRYRWRHLTVSLDFVSNEHINYACKLVFKN